MSIDGKTALLRTRHRLETRVGHSNKERHVPLLGAKVLRHLEERDGTIDFDPRSEQAMSIGLKTAWGQVAYDMALDRNLNTRANPTVIDRCESARLHTGTIARAFYQIRRHLRDDHVYPLFILPRNFGSKIIEVITIQPEYQVNAVQKAADLAIECGNKRTREFIRQVRDRYQLMTGQVDGFSLRLHAIVEEVSQEASLQPMLNFDPSAEAG
jgi:hypothetical protein